MRGKGGGGQLLRLFPYIDAKKTIPDSISHSSQQRDGYSNVRAAGEDCWTKFIDQVLASQRVFDCPTKSEIILKHVCSSKSKWTIPFKQKMQTMV